MNLLKSQAIQIALTGNWEKAVELNHEVLLTEPADTETLNRLAFAYTALGKSKEAKETYEKVLLIDPLNPIAQRGIKRINTSGVQNRLIPSHLVSNMFLEESGKTKIVTLVNTAPAKVVRNLQIGQTVVLCTKRMKIFVQDENKEYIGVLPDDIGKRLIKFIEGGNMYETYIKAANDHGVTVFVRETKRAARFKNQPTFLFGEKTTLGLSKGLIRQAQADVSSDDE
ncbi:MAG TPA: tetratricopeptide repeat protein [Candidatus Saccharimonadales bacterium]|nr:tetratricopeptide repeat protein [Candidatus Saccharimonadales bacterium]